MRNKLIPLNETIKSKQRRLAKEEMKKQKIQERKAFKSKHALPVLNKIVKAAKIVKPKVEKLKKVRTNDRAKSYSNFQKLLSTSKLKFNSKLSWPKGSSEEWENEITRLNEKINESKKPKTTHEISKFVKKRDDDPSTYPVVPLPEEEKEKLKRLIDSGVPATERFKLFNKYYKVRYDITDVYKVIKEYKVKETNAYLLLEYFLHRRKQATEMIPLYQLDIDRVIKVLSKIRKEIGSSYNEIIDSELYVIKALSNILYITIRKRFKYETDNDEKKSSFELKAEKMVKRDREKAEKKAKRDKERAEKKANKLVVLNRRRSKHGAFFKYLINSNNISEKVIKLWSRYGLYSSVQPNNYTENCLFKALKESGKVDSKILDMLKHKMNTTEIPLSTAKDIFVENKLKVKIISLSPTGIRKTITIGEGRKNEFIEIGLLDDHYFIIDKLTGVSKFYIEKNEECNKFISMRKKTGMKELSSYVLKRCGSRGIGIDNKKSCSSFDLVRLLLKNQEKLLREITIDTAGVLKTVFYDKVSQEISTLMYSKKCIRSMDIFIKNKKIKEQINKLKCDEYSLEKKLNIIKDTFIQLIYGKDTRNMLLDIMDYEFTNEKLERLNNISDVRIKSKFKTKILELTKSKDIFLNKLINSNYLTKDGKRSENGEKQYRDSLRKYINKAFDIVSEEERNYDDLLVNNELNKYDYPNTSGMKDGYKKQNSEKTFIFFDFESLADDEYSYKQDKYGDYLDRSEQIPYCIGYIYENDTEADLLTITSHNQNPIELFLDKIPNDCVLASHNLGFDGRLFIKYAPAESIKMIGNMLTSGKRIFQMNLMYKGKKFTMKDTVAMIPDRLKNFTKMFGLKSAKAPMRYEAVNRKVLNTYVNEITRDNLLSNIRDVADEKTSSKYITEQGIGLGVQYHTTEEVKKKKDEIYKKYGKEKCFISIDDFTKDFKGTVIEEPKIEWTEKPIGTDKLTIRMIYMARFIKYMKNKKDNDKQAFHDEVINPNGDLHHLLIRNDKGVKGINPVDYAAAYCAIDCVVLRDGYMKMREYVFDLCDALKIERIEIKNMLSVAALSKEILIRSGCMDGTYSLSGHVREFIQRCCVGGRTMTRLNEKYILEKDDKLNSDKKIFYNDMVSLYPSSITELKGFMKGKPKMLLGHQSNMNALNKFDYYFVEINVKKVNRKIPFPIVNKIDEKNVRQFDNDITGKIYIDKINLEDAIKYQNIEFDIIRGYYFDEGFNPKCIDVITTLFNKRIEMKKVGNPVQNIYKLVLNAIYGKLLQKPIKTSKSIKQGHQLVTCMENNLGRIKKMSSIDDEDSKKKYHAQLVKYNLSKDKKSLEYIKKRETKVDKDVLEKMYIMHEENKMKRDRDAKEFLDFGRMVVEINEPIDIHYNECHIACSILSSSKRMVNRILDICERNNVKTYYSDTDSMCMIMSENDKQNIERDYKSVRLSEGVKNPIGLFGKYMTQMHNDYNDDFNDKGHEVTSIKSIILGKKMHYHKIVKSTKNKLRTEDHVRLKGVPSYCLDGPENLFEKIIKDKSVEFKVSEIAKKKKIPIFTYTGDFLITDNSYMTKSVSINDKEIIHVRF